MTKSLYNLFLGNVDLCSWKCQPNELLTPEEVFDFKSVSNLDELENQNLHKPKHIWIYPISLRLLFPKL